MIKNIDHKNVIHYGKNSLIVFVKKDEFSKPYCLKILNEEFPSPEVIEEFENEFKFSQIAELDCIRKAIERTSIENHPTFAFEYIEGANLKNFLSGNSLSLIERLNLAIEITNAISNIQKLNIFHGQITPTNILVEKGTNKIFLIDFGKAVIQTGKVSEIKNVKVTKPEALPYLAPEQTGRINRSIDSRADMYSLGIIFYELFTGQLPFSSIDAGELMYSHIAKIPVSPHLINTNVPKSVAELVMKLLAKNAEDRYQSAYGVYYDLERISKAFSGNHISEDFELATNDYSGKYYPLQKLYGRSKELSILQDIFKETVSGEKRMVVVSGYSGSGKSTLINEIKPSITNNKGLLITGKFDPLQSGTPYSAFVQAFTELKDHILAQEPLMQRDWKDRITAALGNTGGLLNDLIPGMETLIGRQPGVAELKGTEAQNRFNYTLLNFIKAAAGKDQPLVIFLDDTQWADASSLNFLKVMLAEHDLSHIMIITSYRINEVKAGDRLHNLLEELRLSGNFFDELILENLEFKDVLLLTEELFHTRQSDAKQLAEIVYNKTKGNPFYVQQFLKSIYEEGLLQFDFDKRKWNWNKDLILQMNVSGNVVDLMTSLIQKLPAATIDILKVASCFGNRFEKRSLSIIRQITEKEVNTLLSEPIAEGLIITVGDQFKFAHDRIQQAIYSLLSDEEKQHIHLLLGKALSASTIESELQNKIFDIVNQWNLASGLVTDKETQLYLAKINLTAARKAIVSTAYTQALLYYEKSLSQVSGDDWKSNYDFMLQLTGEAAEAAYLTGDYEKVDLWVDQITKSSKSFIDTTKASEISIKKLIAQNKLLDAIDLGLKILEQMGARLSKRPGKLSTLGGLLLTKWVMRKRDANFFMSLPEMKDKEKMALMRILSDISSASYFAAPELVPLLIFRMVRLTVKFGLSRNSPYSFAAYGFILSAYMGEIDHGINYGKIALNIVDKLGADELKGSILTTNNVFLSHWRTPLKQTVRDLESAFVNSLQAGDHEWSSYAAHNMVYQLFIMGFPLKELARKSEVLNLQIEKFRQHLTIRRLKIFRQSVNNLLVVKEQPWEFKGAIFDEDEMKEANVTADNKVYFHNLYFQKCYLSLIFNEDQKAYEYGIEAGHYLESVRGSALYPLYYFYHSLAVSGKYIETGEKLSRIDFRLLKRNLKKIRHFEKLCPENYHYKRLFIEAEIYKLTGNNIMAKTCYDETLKAATEQNMTHDLALCWERSAQFFIKTQQEVLARFYLQNAYKAYLQWGADGKLEQMRNRYVQLESSSKYDLEPDIANGSPKHLEEDLDLSTVIKAATALSGEIVLSNLLKKLIQITLESAGAQSGFVIMEKNGVQYIEASIAPDNDEAKTLQSIPVKESGLLAESIVNYVYLTHEIVILDNAVHSNLFANDDFIKTHRSKSILCFPLLNQGNLQGIIYLSNNLTAGAFVERRLALLKLLSGQIAVSIENALFYTGLENKVKERTAELEVEKKKSDDLLLNILPKEIASELKQTGFTQPRSYKLATVMFTDFKNFTTQSELLSPEELVTLIDTYFKKFDEIISRYQIEKIKTIGDAYLCLSGLPNPDEHNAVNVVKAAQEILAFIKSYKEEALLKSGSYFDIRIGIHSGPLVAGVVGNKKFSYDIWGDTVNTAARMEQSCETNNINISQSTYDLVKEHFDCSSRGKQHAKNKGMIDMYFVESTFLPVA